MSKTMVLFVHRLVSVRRSKAVAWRGRGHLHQTDSEDADQRPFLACPQRQSSNCSQGNNEHGHVGHDVRDLEAHVEVVQVEAVPRHSGIPEASEWDAHQRARDTADERPESDDATDNECWDLDTAAGEDAVVEVQNRALGEEDGDGVEEGPGEEHLCLG
jgi:hypothetical protein